MYLFNAGNKYTRCLIKTVFIIFLLFGQYKAYSVAFDIAVSPKGIFDTIKVTPPNKRVALATFLYKSNFRKVSEAAAMSALNDLSTMAQGLNDIQLECAVFDMRADYYSVNKGFNKFSTSYYQQAIDFAKANNLLVETGMYLHKLGVYYHIFGHNVEACQSFLRSQEIFNQVGYSNVSGISSYLSDVASFYYSLGDFDNAKINLEAALKYPAGGKREKVNMVNTIGLIYRNNKQFSLAIPYFNQALALAKASKDTAWIGIAQGNIGSAYFMQGQYEKALPYIETDYKTSLIYNEPVNAAIALLRLIKINIDEKKFDDAKQGLLKVKTLLKDSREDVLPPWTDYYDLKSQLYEQQGKAMLSMAARKQYELNKDSLAKRNNIAAVERVKLRFEIDRHATQLNKLKADEKIQSIEIDSAIAVLVLLIIISALLYNRQTLKNKKDKELLIAEKRIVDEELKNADLALHNFTENLRKQNALIENFKTEIGRLKQQSAGNEDAGNLEKLLQVHIMTDESWNDFKKLFLKVHPGFFVNLSKSHPHLSATDTRMLALIKLGLTNSEMSNMLGITTEGIKKAKQRLRKKIDIDAIRSVHDIDEMD